MPHRSAPPEATAEHLARGVAGPRAASPAPHAAWAVVPAAAAVERRAVGAVDDHRRNPRRRRRETGGFVPDPARRGRGLAQEAVQALPGHRFGTPGAHRVAAAVSPANAAPIRLVGRPGLRREGGPPRGRVPVADGGWMRAPIANLPGAGWRGPDG
jgi:RimJ/RimL family protein N-acetyltransferase